MLFAPNAAVLLALLFACGPATQPAEPQEHIVCSAVFDGKLICVSKEGPLHVWDAAGGTPDRGAVADFSGAADQHPIEIAHLAAGANRLCAADRKSYYEWTAAQHRWFKSGDLPRGEDELESMVIADDHLILIYPKFVIDAENGARYAVPKPKGNMPGYLRVLATHATGNVLWIGTGFGEWGGRLLGLDVKTGKWVQYEDDVHYVTGITHNTENELVVSWSMSHFSAETLIRVHRNTAKPRVEFPALKSNYIQAVSFSPFDQVVYAVNLEELVTIVDGKPVAIAPLNQVAVFERERMAIGVAPAVDKLVPLGPKTLLIVPHHGLPSLFRNGKLEPFRAP